MPEWISSCCMLVCCRETHTLSWRWPDGFISVGWELEQEIEVKMQELCCTGFIHEPQVCLQQSQQHLSSTRTPCTCCCYTSLLLLPLSLLLCQQTNQARMLAHNSKGQPLRISNGQLLPNSGLQQPSNGQQRPQARGSHQAPGGQLGPGRYDPSNTFPGVNLHILAAACSCSSRCRRRLKALLCRAHRGHQGPRVPEVRFWVA